MLHNQALAVTVMLLLKGETHLSSYKDGGAVWLHMQVLVEGCIRVCS